MDLVMSQLKGHSKKKYSEDAMFKAVTDVKAKVLSAYGAAKKYNVPVSTLRDRLKGVHNKPYGSEKVLSDDEELQLAEWVILCSRCGYPKTKTQILSTAAEIAKLHPNKTFLRGIPTSGWFAKFVKRHPEVKKRTPESLGKASAAITPEQLKNYFDLVESQFETAGRRELLNKPESWWNIDETSFELNPTPNKVYAEKGAKNVHIIEQGKPKENITCTYAVCADGNFVPPLITFKESFSNLDVAAYVSKDIGANFGFNHTESGWMKGDAFYYFVTQHLYPRWLQMGTEFPVVLVIDGYSAHKSSNLFVWCNQHDVILVLLYPNSTHIIQVLDIAMFGPLKNKYKALHADWKQLYPTENFTELEFIKVLKVTNDAIIKPNTIINGWRASGLQPFNFSNINLNKLLTNDSTKHNNQIQQEPTIDDSIITEPLIVVRNGMEYVLCDDDVNIEIDDWQEIEDENRLGAGLGEENHHENELQQFEGENSNTNVQNDENQYEDESQQLEFENSNVNLKNNENQYEDESQQFVVQNSNTNEKTTENQIMEIVEATGASTGISFSAIHRDIGLFANDLNDTYPDHAFGLDKCSENNFQSTSETVTKQIKTLVEKNRQNIHRMGMLLKVHDPPKMLNILVMAQQLNIIDPVTPVVEIGEPPLPQTVQDILKVPTAARTTKRVQNKKLSYGVMSDVEIVDAIEGLVEKDKAHERELEADKLAEIERAKEIDELEGIIKEGQNSINEKKEKLKSLKAQKISEKKESAKRKMAGNIQKKQRNEKQLKEST